jgi:DNA-binding response OmpR family regulator
MQMSLARGEALVPEGVAGSSSSDTEPAVVIAIAASMDERLRVARIISPHAPLLLVASREEALRLLARGATEHVEPVRELPAPDPPPLVAGVDVDSEWRTLHWQGSSVALSPLEHDLLLCLLDPPLRTWTFALLHRTVWGNDHIAGRDDVQSVVKRLRRKLRQVGSPLGIRAVRGVGLRVVDHREPAPAQRSAVEVSRPARLPTQRRPG